MKTFKIVVLLSLLLLGTLVRLYKIDSPVADWHSHRQADTAAVTRNFVDLGVNLLRPIYYDISNIQTGRDNPHGLRFVEFPVYNYLSFLNYKFLSFFNLNYNVDTASRLTSVYFSIICAGLIFLVSRKYTGQYWPSLFASGFFLFLPFSIYYSRAILPESLAIAFMVATMYFYPRHLLLSSITLSLAILTQPYTALVIFPYLAIFGLIHLGKHFNLKQIIAFVIFASISLIPFILWRRYIANYPEGVPASDWLFNQGSLRFRPAWFRWLFYERISLLIMGSYGIIPLILGFAYRRRHTTLLISSLFFGSLLFLTVIARGNIQHDYYQTFILPWICLSSGFGLYYLVHYAFSNRLLAIVASFTTVVFALAFSWYQVKGYYQINHYEIVLAGQKADEIIPTNGRVIAPYFGDTAFLYQTHRFGWPIEVYDLDKHRALGPLYLVSVNYDQYTNSLASQYPSLYKDDRFIILDLNHALKK